MGVRNCQEIGENLQKIVKRLLANDNLIKLLYYTDKDPLSQPLLTEEEKQKHYADQYYAFDFKEQYSRYVGLILENIAKKFAS